MFEEGRQTQAIPLGWKLRRVAFGLRQQDVASRAGMSTTRYSAIERGEMLASKSDIAHLEQVLPALSPTLLEACEGPVHRVSQAPDS